MTQQEQIRALTKEEELEIRLNRIKQRVHEVLSKYITGTVSGGVEVAIIQAFSDEGVVLKVNRELPKLSQDEFEEWCGSHQVKGCGQRVTMCDDQCVFLAMNDKAGLVAVGPLIYPEPTFKEG